MPFDPVTGEQVAIYYPLPPSPTRRPPPPGGYEAMLDDVLAIIGEKPGSKKFLRGQLRAMDTGAPCAVPIAPYRPKKAVGPSFAGGSHPPSSQKDAGALRRSSRLARASGSVVARTPSPVLESSPTPSPAPSLSGPDSVKFFDPAIIEFFEAVLAPSIADGVAVVPDTNPAHSLLWLVNNTPPFETVSHTDTLRVLSPPPLPRTPTSPTQTTVSLPPPQAAATFLPLPQNVTVSPPPPQTPAVSPPTLKTAAAPAPEQRRKRKMEEREDFPNKASRAGPSSESAHQVAETTQSARGEAGGKMSIPCPFMVGTTTCGVILDSGDIQRIRDHLRSHGYGGM